MIVGIGVAVIVVLLFLVAMLTNRSSPPQQSSPAPRKAQPERMFGDGSPWPSCQICGVGGGARRVDQDRVGPDDVCRTCWNDPAVKENLRQVDRLEDLHAALDRPRESAVRSNAVDKLSKLGDAHAREVLTARFLASKDRWAAHELATLGSAEPFCATLRDDDGWWVAGEAGELPPHVDVVMPTLRNWGGARLIVTTYVRALEEAAPSRQRSIASALKEMLVDGRHLGYPDQQLLLEPLSRVLAAGDVVPAARVELAEALACWRADSHVAAALRSAANDQDEDVRRAAADALDAQPETAASTPLLRSFALLIAARTPLRAAIASRCRGGARANRHVLVEDDISDARGMLTSWSGPPRLCARTEQRQGFRGVTPGYFWSYQDEQGTQITYIRMTVSAEGRVELFRGGGGPHTATEDGWNALFDEK